MNEGNQHDGGQGPLRLAQPHTPTYREQMEQRMTEARHDIAMRRLEVALRTGFGLQ